MDLLETKLDTLELTEGADAIARSRIAQLEKIVTDQMAAVSKRLEDSAKKSASAATSASVAATATRARGPSFDGTIVIVGVFPQDTLRGPMEQAWAQHLQRVAAENMNIEGMHVEAPFLLSSALQARYTSASQARRSGGCSPPSPSWARRPTSTRRFRNRRRSRRNKLLLRTAEKLQSFLHPSVSAQPPYRCVCWKSSNIVIQGRRICKITRADDGSFTIDFGPNWFDARTFVNTEQVVETVMRDQLDAKSRPI